MAGDVFFQDVKPADSPRGSIEPPGSTVEQVDGELTLRLPPEMTRVETPIIYPNFTVVVEGDELEIDGPTIVDAALNCRILRAGQANVRASKDIEVTELIQARQVKGRVIRSARIEAGAIEAELSIVGTAAVVTGRATINNGTLRTPVLVTDEMNGDSAALVTHTWADGASQGLVPDWLADANG